MRAHPSEGDPLQLSHRALGRLLPVLRRLRQEMQDESGLLSLFG
jgi:hypothetical protein